MPEPEMDRAGHAPSAGRTPGVFFFSPVTIQITFLPSGNCAGRQSGRSDQAENALQHAVPVPSGILGPQLKLGIKWFIVNALLFPRCVPIPVQRRPCAQRSPTAYLSQIELNDSVDSLEIIWFKIDR
jgi:hypothetical protein